MVVKFQVIEEAYVKDVSPGNAEGPVGPVGPVNPAGPVGPVTVEAAPVGPVGPVNPTAPVGPVVGNPRSGGRRGAAKSDFR